MAGLYLHIPFCRKACHYCNFHFSTSLHRKAEMVAAMVKEIETLPQPANVTADRQVSTIYLGGGTPSLLSPRDLSSVFAAIHRQFDIAETAEITLEANPDDITENNLEHWQQVGINRLSIGIQSFFEEDLRWMNRAHNSTQAMDSIVLAKKNGFSNLSIDLIYGTPSLSDENWRKNVNMAIEAGITHLSCYALTVEEKTALHHFIEKGKVPAISDDHQSRQLLLLVAWMAEAGFEHYEISNFCRPGHRSRHNSSYWQGLPYYGFGPSAHSFDGGLTRWWNLANNNLYIENLQNNLPVFEQENLTARQRLNEKIMTGLRRMEGIGFDPLAKSICGEILDAKTFLACRQQIENYESQQLVIFQGNRVRLSNQGKLYADGIASSLFLS